jgi:hypothetical protein
MTGRALGQVMLRALEVSIELWLALSWSPQAQWLNEDAHGGPLALEVRGTNPGTSYWLLPRVSFFLTCTTA